MRAPSWEKRAAYPTGNGAGAPVIADGMALRQATSNSIRALQLIRAYRVRGHLEADLDPLGLDKRGPYPELDYRSYGFSEADLDREIFINSIFDRDAPACVRSWQSCGKPIAARLASSTCTSRCRPNSAWIQASVEARPPARPFGCRQKSDPRVCSRPLRPSSGFSTGVTPAQSGLA